VYTLDILLLKQKKLSVLDITGFSFRIRTDEGLGATHLGLDLSTHAEKKKPCYTQYRWLLFFQH